MKYLVTGGCGFLGSNLASEVLKMGKELVVFDSLYRLGSNANLDWLRGQGAFRFVHGDIRNREDTERVISEERPDAIFHVAGQVAMTTSLQNPRLDFEVNALGTFNLLEAVRKWSSESVVVYSSTNKVYGNLEWVKYEETATRYVAPDFPEGFPETIPLDFHSPYGCSKGAADQYMLDYCRMFGIRTVVFRHSSMYGNRQFATHDQGWIGWFCQKAIETKKRIPKETLTISGNGKQVRDILYIKDAVDLYFRSVENIEKVKGQAFNIGSGIESSVSLLELFSFLENELDMELSYEKLPPREGDQKVFVADIGKISNLVRWKPIIDKEKGIRMMLDWLVKERRI